MIASGENATKIDTTYAKANIQSIMNVRKEHGLAKVEEYHLKMQEFGTEKNIQ